MSTGTGPRPWSEVRWPDAAADAARWIALLPLAATEQHGPHLPLGTDTLIAQAYLARVKALLPAGFPLVVLPIQEIGVSTEHISFPGTLTHPPQTALESWIAIGDSVARTGISKLVMVTSHGGNSAMMSAAALELRARRGLFVVTTAWSRFGLPDGLFPDEEVRHGIHGGAVETSIMLAARPDLVRMDQIGNFVPASVAMERDNSLLSAQRPAPFAWLAQDLNTSGAVGDATLASAEKGHALIAHGAQAMCDLLDDVLGFDLASLRTGPGPL